MDWDEHGSMVRPERPKDWPEVAKLLRAAFGRAAEAELVGRLRLEPGFDPELSLVAWSGGRVIGHVLFTPVGIVSGRRRTPALAMAPVAVLPQFQRQGVGSTLILEGLMRCRARGHEIVVVVGQPGYYARFGFERASLYRIVSPFDVPDEAFMVTGLTADALSQAGGSVHYPPPFDEG